MTLKPCDKWDNNPSSVEAYIANISTWINSFFQLHSVQLTVQYHVSYIQSTEWNNTTVTKRSDKNNYSSENAPISVPFIF